MRQRGAGHGRRRSFADAGPERAPDRPRRGRAAEVRRLPDVRLHVGALPRGTCRIQMFHGVGGKYGFDAPTESLRAWDRLFFVNERRLRNCVAVRRPRRRQPGDPPDRDAEGGLPRRRFASRRTACCASLGLPPDRPTVLYAPTWSPASSLNTLGVELVRAPARAAGQRDRQAARSLARSAAAVLGRRRLARRRSAPHSRRWTAVLATGGRHLAVPRGGGRDGHRPQLRRLRVPAARSAARADRRAGADRAGEHPPGLRRGCSPKRPTRRAVVDDTVAAVERALADPMARSATRRAVASDSVSRARDRDGPVRRGAVRGDWLGSEPHKAGGREGGKAGRQGITAGRRPGDSLPSFPPSRLPAFQPCG